MEPDSNEHMPGRWGELRPDRVALAIALKRCCGPDVISSVAGADNGVGADAHAQTLRRLLASGVLPDEPSFDLIEALSLSRYAEPEEEARSEVQEAHAARALALTALLMLAAREGADPSDFFFEADAANLARSAWALGAEVRSGAIRTLASVVEREAQLGPLTAHLGAALAVLTVSEPTIEDGLAAEVCLHALALSERYHRPRAGKWTSRSNAEEGPEWLDRALVFYDATLRAANSKRGPEARAAIEMLGVRLLGWPRAHGG